MECVFRFFDAPAGSQCLRFSFDLENYWGGQVVRQVKVSATLDAHGDGPFSEIGTIVLADIPYADFPETITVRVTSNQSVIHNPKGLLTIPGPYALNYRRAGFYQASGSQERKPLTGHFKPNASNLDVLIDGKIYLDFVGSLYQ